MSFKLTDPVGQVHDAEAAEDVGQFSLVRDDLNHVRQFRHRMRIARGIAAHHNRFRARILSRQLPYHLPRFGITRVRDRTRIHDAQVGRLIVVRFTITALQQGFADELSFILIDFAAQGHQAAGSKWGHCLSVKQKGVKD